MKKTILLLVLVLITLPAMPQGKKYKKSMLKAIEMKNKASDQAVALESVAVFENLATKYPEQWLPHYYAAELLITNSFEEGNLARNDELLNRALKNLDQAKGLAPEESEIEAMKGMYYIGMMASDPESRGPMYYQDALMSIEKSKAQNPGIQGLITWML